MNDNAPNIQVGSVQAEHKVVIRLGAMFMAVSPPTARAIAIALIHHAEIAGLPDPESVPAASENVPDRPDSAAE